MESTVITFKNTSSFSDWPEAYNESIPLQKGLVSIFRGNDKGEPTQSVITVSAEPGQLDKFMEANFDMVDTFDHVLDSTVLISYTS